MNYERNERIRRAAILVASIDESLAEQMVDISLPQIDRDNAVDHKGIFIVGNYGTHTVVPQVAELVGAEPPEKTIPPSPGHEREWLDCIRSREEPSCGVNYMHKVNTSNNLANLAMKLGRELRFDPATEQIVGDDEAAKAARPEYRAPWKFPEEYL